ncbi:MAG: NHL repeat-containing protein [Acidobacteriota bacterium]
MPIWKSSSPARKIVFLLVFIFILAAAFAVYRLVFKKQVPTNPQAIGQVLTLAGAGYTGVENGQARQAAFSDPFGIAVDDDGNIYVADAGQCNCIRRINAQGNVETVAGFDEGFNDGSAGQAKFNTPSAIAFDNNGNLIIADTSNNRLRKLDKKGQVTTLAGTGNTGFKDGSASEAEFDSPIGVAVDEEGVVYVADTYNDRIRKISKDGEVTTLAGTGAAGYQDGEAQSAMFDTPGGIAVDKLGNIFVADTGNDAIRKISKQGEVTTIAGGLQNNDEANADKPIRQPVGLALTHDGFLFIASSGNGRVYRLSPESSLTIYAGFTSGFNEGIGEQAKFNGISGIALDREGNLFVADSNNFLIRKVAPGTNNSIAQNSDRADAPFIQPAINNEANGNSQQIETAIPRIDKEVLNIASPFPYPLSPQSEWHEFAGVVGEVRGWFNGEARDHFHSGLDVVGKMGDNCLSVMDEKVTAPIANWGFNDTGEGLRVGLISYIHIRIGRTAKDEILDAKFKPRFDTSKNLSLDSGSKLIGVRVRRGTRFRVGDFIGTLNRLNHVHMNVGPRNGEANAIAFPFANFKDTVAPVIEPNGIEITSPDGKPFKEKSQGRLVITGDVAIQVTAYDRIDGNGASRKLGLYRVGYQLLTDTRAPVKGFEQPLINIEFNRLPAAMDAVKLAYAEGSGVSAYGTPTKFKYLVTNRVRDGQAQPGWLRTSLIAPGNYILKIIAEDFTGNRVADGASEILLTIK